MTNMTYGQILNRGKPIKPIRLCQQAGTCQCL